MSKSLGIINKTTVVASFIIPIVFICGSFVSVYQHHSNSVTGLLYMLICVLLTTVGYWGSLIQGIRSISNGRYATILSGAIFQLIMYVMHLTNSVLETYYMRRSSSAMKGFFAFFNVILTLMIVINVVKLIMVSKTKDAQATTATPSTARKVLLRFVIFPVVYIAMVIGAYSYLQEHPGVGRTIGFIVALIIILGAFIFFIISGGHHGVFVKNDISKNDSRSSEEEQLIVDEFNRRYEEEFRRITGVCPMTLDYRNIQSVPAKEQVERLRRKMQIEAKQQGVFGKTKWF